jgi:hypothetical protein
MQTQKISQFDLIINLLPPLQARGCAPVARYQDPDGFGPPGI